MIWYDYTESNTSKAVSARYWGSNIRYNDVSNVSKLTSAEYVCRKQSMLPLNCCFPEARTSVPSLVRAKSRGYNTASDTAPDDAPERSDMLRYVQKCSIGTPSRYSDRNLCPNG